MNNISLVVKKWDVESYKPSEKNGKVVVISAGGLAVNALYRSISFVAGTALALISLAFIGLGVATLVFAFSGSFTVLEAMDGILFLAIPSFVLVTPAFAKGALFFYQIAFYRHEPKEKAVPTWRVIDN